MNTFWLSFLGVSMLTGLFVFLFMVGLIAIARATRKTSMPAYQWDREPVTQLGQKTAPFEKPRMIRPRGPAPELEL